MTNEQTGAFVARGVPVSSIRWIVGNFNVMDPNEEVEADMRRRCGGKVNEATTEAVVEFALAVHEENRALYWDIQMGRIG